MSRFSFLYKYKVEFLISLVFGVLISLLEVFSVSLIFPLLSDHEVDSRSQFLQGIFAPFETFSMEDKIVLISVLIVVATLFKSVLLYLKSIIAAKVRASVTSEFQRLTFNKILGMGLIEFKKQKTGDLQTITTIHTNNVGIIAGKLISALHYPLIVIFVAFLMMQMSYELTFLSLSTTGLMFFGLKYVNRKADVKARLVAPSHKSLGSSLLEFLKGKKTILIYNMNNYIDNLFNIRVVDYERKVVSMEYLRGLVMPLGGLISSFCIAVILIGSVKLGDFSNSTLLVFLAAFSRLSPPINAIVQLRASVAGEMPYLDDLNNFLNQADSFDEKRCLKNEMLFTSKIEFKDVSYRYPGDDKDTFKNLDITIEKGQKLTIVGGSGAGKTTLINLFLGLMTPTRGEILIDGQKLNQENSFSWRDKVGVVSQDTFLFNDTIQNNITIGKEREAELSALEQAVSKSHLSEYIDDLENGIDSSVGENGGSLSGGQQQRVSIARALYKRPEVLVFDEATSALDYKTESLIQKSIQELSKEESKTIIVVTHRLSSIGDNDQVIVLGDGGVLENGPHCELIAKKDHYYNLYHAKGMNA